jgi:hypothetical protein
LFEVSIESRFVRQDRAELLATYGRVLPIGTIEPGDGTERCLVCGYRDNRSGFLLWLPGPMSVCSIEHARVLAAHLAEREPRKAAI